MAGVFFATARPFTHGHMKSNNETVSRQMSWAVNIAKTMTSNGKQFTVTHKMLTAVARDQSVQLKVYLLLFVFCYILHVIHLKEHCHRRFAVFSFIRCCNLYLVPLLVPKMLKWSRRNISNEWWLREQTIMNLWQYFQEMALEFEKNWLVFSNFNPFPSLPC